MPNPEYFHCRAAAYRQHAREAKDDYRAVRLHEIANLFASMADDLARLKSTEFAVIEDQYKIAIAGSRSRTLMQMAASLMF